jgi:hypothetical protein
MVGGSNNNNHEFIGLEWWEAIAVAAHTLTGHACPCHNIPFARAPDYGK